MQGDKRGGSSIVVLHIVAQKIDPGFYIEGVVNGCYGKIRQGGKVEQHRIAR